MKVALTCLLAVLVSAFSVLTMIVVAAWLMGGLAFARDFGQWDTDSETRAWFQSLRMPDNPTASCCGEADGYWCDDLHVRDGEAYCNITDDRDNDKLIRQPVPLGTEVLIPSNKIGTYPGNPTGHAIVFMSIQRMNTEIIGKTVYCYVQGGGI